MCEHVVHAGFDAPGGVHAALAAEENRQKRDGGFHADGVGLRLRLPARRACALKARLRDATRNRVRIDDNG